ncbi:hypothetical protein KP509_25G012200 [Ceratopteris richardii]|uniref:Origin of replication complex subunit 4 n=1 Tax=Ceratopteris richardii TaxID=49495 RepID=A0A8T2RMW6_CERRI|nr:hypothetical protein KP509_25G012200 [Ceratopteris richardii]
MEPSSPSRKRKYAVEDECNRIGAVQVGPGADQRKAASLIQLPSVESSVVGKAICLLRSRLCNHAQAHILPDAQDNKRKIYELFSETVRNGCNNSILLLGPRGCGKTMVLNKVIAEVQEEYPERLCFVRLSGLLHADDYSALREIARQLCIEHRLVFSKSASFDDNSQFLTSMLRECALSHKTVVFILDDFDLFAQMSKQKLLYNLLNTMQSKEAQALVIGVSCRLDADQLLEKRVRSRFSHRKILFNPPLADELQKILPELLILSTDSSIVDAKYVEEFNCVTQDIFKSKEMGEILHSIMAVDVSPRHLLNFLFAAVCTIDRNIGLFSLSNFKMAHAILRRQNKLESLRDVSVLELYLLVSMKRLESKEREIYNFNTIFKEYKSLHDSHSTCDLYPQEVCQRAFENLLERQLIMFADGRKSNIGIEFCPVKLLVSSYELEEGLKSSPVCPTILRQWFAHEEFK